MGEATKIEWCHHTFNPWWGCSRISEGCRHCYAEAFAARLRKPLWGDRAERQPASESVWAQPLKWNAAAAKAGERRRVFCGSMMDVFENREDLVNSRIRLFELIRQTPNLDWLLLTKRPRNAYTWLEGSQLQGLWPMPNVWIGVTVENQAAADERIPILLKIPAAVRFLSCEPLLGRVNLSEWLDAGYESGGPAGWIPESCGLHWVIAGGESGRSARPCDLKWLRSLRDQCKAADVPYFLKQLGDNPHGDWGDDTYPTVHVMRGGVGVVEPNRCQNGRWKLRAAKGGWPDEWPEDLRGCREFPEVKP